MATEFTLFPKLITELRLEIWRLALPAPLSRLLYPYKKGCWVVDDLGLEPDPNGEDLYLKFDTGLLEPLRLDLSLYSVNSEARSVVVKYFQKNGIVAPPRGGARSESEFLRVFDSRTDTMMVPTLDMEDFISEPIYRIHEPDLVGRYVSNSNPALPSLAITSSAFEAFKQDDLSTFFDFGGIIKTIYVFDDAYELEASRGCVQQLEGSPRARLQWNSPRREWEASGDEQALLAMRRLVAGLDEPASSTSDYDLDIQLVRLTSPGIRRR